MEGQSMKASPSNSEGASGVVMDQTPKQILLLLVVATCLVACSDKVSETPGPNDPPTAAPPPTAGITVTTEQRALINAVKKTGAKSADGQVVSKVCELARAHLDYM